MDTKKLIVLIRERECLWNQNSEHYRSRNVQRCAWNEIAVQLNSKEEEVKKKWKGLRDIFRRECKKAKVQTSGKEHTPKWPYYKIMLFLDDTPTLKDVKSVFPCEDNEDELDADTFPGETEEDDSGTISQVHLPTTQVSHVVSDSPEKKVYKRAREECIMDVKPIRKEKNLQVDKGNLEDSEMLFLKSLYPFLRRISPARQLAVRTDMMRALMSDSAAQRYSPCPSHISSDNGHWLSS